MAVTCRPIRREPDGSIIISEVIIGNDDRILTTTTSSSAAVIDWIKETHELHKSRSRPATSYQMVGIAVSCHPSGDIALLQLCAENRCLIYQLTQRGVVIPEELFAFINDARFCYAGCGIDMITKQLERTFNFLVNHVIDLGMATNRQDLRHATLEQLAKELMQLEIEKPDEVRMSVWWVRELTNEQIAYACMR